MTFCKIDGCLNHGSYGGYCTSHQSQRAERAEAERDRLRAFVTVYDAWATDGDVFGDPFDAMVEARAALDAPAEKEQTK